MRVPSVGRRTSVSFNVTSLIDIVFLLIIFFLVASHVARSDATEPVELPEAAEFQDTEDEAPRRLVVTVRADRSLSVAGKQVTLGDIEIMLQEVAGNERELFEVRIRSDRTATYAEVEPILLACARNGISRVGFAVTPRTSL